MQERILALPLYRMFALYFIVASVALLFPHRPASWPLLLALHLLVVVVGWPLVRSERVVAHASPAARRRIRSFTDWLPLLIVPLVYTELAPLNRAVHNGAYFDDIILGWEQSLFGGQPSREWAAAAPQLWLSETLHAAYLSYYLIIYVPPLILFLRGRTEAFRTMVFTLMLTFLGHYLFFIYFPVQGPRYLFPAPSGELANGALYQLTHRLLEAGSSQGAAFPSSHVGVAMAQTLLTMRFMPRLAPIVGVVSLGLALGAIYGGFHYATDAVAGFVLAALLVAIAAPLHRWLGARHGDRTS